jgi:hypothetical protein
LLYSILFGLKKEVYDPNFGGGSRLKETSVNMNNLNNMNNINSMNMTNNNNTSINNKKDPQPWIID